LLQSATQLPTSLASHVDVVRTLKLIFDKTPAVCADALAQNVGAESLPRLKRNNLEATPVYQ